MRELGAEGEEVALEIRELDGAGGLDRDVVVGAPEPAGEGGDFCIEEWFTAGEDDVPGSGGAEGDEVVRLVRSPRGVQEVAGESHHAQRRLHPETRMKELGTPTREPSP